jgi:hypothetical protein
MTLKEKRLNKLTRRNNEMTFEQVYREFEKLTGELVVGGNNDVLECAGVMMAQALRIYKTSLSENEYHIMTETIIKSRDDIIPMEMPTIN